MLVVSRLSCLQVSLTNVVMELRKLCGHPYLLEGVEPTVRNQAEANRWVLVCIGYEIAGLSLVVDCELRLIRRFT